jgi:peptidoglycan-N-acetylglucosamine deacetylase
MRALLFLLWLAAGADADGTTDAASPLEAGHADGLPDASARSETTSSPAVPLPWFGIASMRTRQPVVALTFDACATTKQDNSFDREIFEILQREHVPATIFPTGRWIEAHPEAARELAAQPWIELGNHSYSHVRMTRVPRRTAIFQLARTDELISQLGRKAVAFRPPAGAWNRRLVRLAARQNMPTVLWDVVSGDPGESASAERISKAVLSSARAGSIVIFHINGRAPHTKQALPDIIRGLRGKGLEFVTLSRLLQQPDGRLRPARPAPYGYRPLRYKKAKNQGDELEPTPI